MAVNKFCLDASDFVLVEATHTRLRAVLLELEHIAKLVDDRTKAKPAKQARSRYNLSKEQPNFSRPFGRRAADEGQLDTRSQSVSRLPVRQTMRNFDDEFEQFDQEAKQRERRDAELAKQHALEAIVGRTWRTDDSDHPDLRHAKSKASFRAAEPPSGIHTFDDEADDSTAVDTPIHQLKSLEKQISREESSASSHQSHASPGSQEAWSASPRVGEQPRTRGLSTSSSGKARIRRRAVDAYLSAPVSSTQAVTQPFPSHRSVASSDGSASETEAGSLDLTDRAARQQPLATASTNRSSSKPASPQKATSLVKHNFSRPTGRGSSYRNLAGITSNRDRDDSSASLASIASAPTKSLSGLDRLSRPVRHSSLTAETLASWNKHQQEQQGPASHDLFSAFADTMSGQATPRATGTEEDIAASVVSTQASTQAPSSRSPLARFGPPRSISTGSFRKRKQSEANLPIKSPAVISVSTTQAAGSSIPGSGSSMNLRDSLKGVAPGQLSPSRGALRSGTPQPEPTQEGQQGSADLEQPPASALSAPEPHPLPAQPSSTVVAPAPSNEDLRTVRQRAISQPTRVIAKKPRKTEPVQSVARLSETRQRAKSFTSASADHSTMSDSEWVPQAPTIYKSDIMPEAGSLAGIALAAQKKDSPPQEKHTWDDVVIPTVAKRLQASQSQNANLADHFVPPLEESTPVELDQASKIKGTPESEPLPAAVPTTSPSAMEAKASNRLSALVASDPARPAVDSSTAAEAVKPQPVPIYPRRNVMPPAQPSFAEVPKAEKTSTTAAATKPAAAAADDSHGKGCCSSAKCNIM
ncbi:uncharacterized protein L969DRAFT_14686 [Mixia osmundae IAM 14324]|uniref:uncharacterized protein n=1 Tax=Mixia osmundae (strain CBS 9802 / IAM 14324 / JCM 22182 / KY 12970) TaxID=764103 RepID=UPI0004A5533F|nr:uncharacterized protein L969DRAFT_14686 [Mixia osmundae IAM 14324]KEI42490.1 hypothetical protein L969DRAFT_14686 [Mixia osmundae IAM 14324]